MPAGAAAVAARKREERRKQQAEAKAARAADKAAKIDAFFAQYDKDASSSLNNDEFIALLQSLYPGSSLNDTVVQMLMDKCGGAVTKQNVIAAVNKYGAVSALLPRKTLPPTSRRVGEAQD